MDFIKEEITMMDITHEFIAQQELGYASIKIFDFEIY